MSGGFDKLALKEEDARLLLSANAHLGHVNCNHQMKDYVYSAKRDGVNVIRVDKTWEKIMLAARVIVAINNPQDIAVVGTQEVCKRAVLKFARYTGAFPFAGRFTPGTFTNQIQKAFREPRLLIVHDTTADHQAITEASYVNIPVVAFCNTNSHLKNVDIAIPCNNENKHSSGLMWWLLAREVQRLRGSISRESAWDVMVDMFFVRDLEAQALEEEQQQQAMQQQQQAIQQTMVPTEAFETFGNEDDWAADATGIAPVGAIGLQNANPISYGAVGDHPGLPGVAPPMGVMQPINNDNWGAATGDDWGDASWQ